MMERSGNSSHDTATSFAARTGGRGRASTRPRTLMKTDHANRDQSGHDGSRRAGGDMKKPARGPVIATEYWHRLEDGRIQCDVCPHFCTLREGQRGLCFVRGRQGDQVVLTTYGRSSGFCVDPIEKKPLNHFLPGTAVLSFGTEGCNLSCKFCQNLVSYTHLRAHETRHDLVCR